MSDLDGILRTDYKAVDKRDAIQSVWGWLSGDSAKVPIVMDGNRPFGVVNERALMSRRINQAAHLESYTLPTRAIREDASLDEVARRMAEARAAHLPVEDKRGRLRGYVSALDVARAQEREATAADLAVPVTALKHTQTIGEALHAFTQEYVDWLPILNGDGKAHAVLPRRTLMRLEANLAEKGRKDANGEKMNPLKDVVEGFSEQIVSRLPASASRDEVLAALDDNGYVLIEGRDGRLLGIVTPTTLLRQT